MIFFKVSLLISLLIQNVMMISKQKGFNLNQYILSYSILYLPSAAKIIKYLFDGRYSIYFRFYSLPHLRFTFIL